MISVNTKPELTIQICQSNLWFPREHERTNERKKDRQTDREREKERKPKGRNRTWTLAILRRLPTGKRSSTISRHDEKRRADADADADAEVKRRPSRYQW